jgi:hypothetical protein
MAEEPVVEPTFVGTEAAQARIEKLSAYAEELRAEKFREVAERVIADSQEILQRLALIEDDEALLARAKELASVANPAEAVTYSEEELEELRRGEGQRITDEINADPKQVAALKKALENAVNGRRRPLREVMDDDDFFVEDEPVEDVLAAFEAGENFLTEQPNRGNGWCAPSP